METVNAEDPRKVELRVLQKRQNDSRDWDPNTDGKRLLQLQEELNPKTNRTPAHLAALHRQGTAGINGAPELTPDERKRIQEANGLL